MMLSASYRGGNRGLYFSDWGVALEHRAGSSTWPFWLFCSVRFHWPNQHYCTWVEWSEPRSASLCHVLLVRGRERRAARSSYCGPWTSWGFPALPWFLTVIRSKLCSLLLGSSRLIVCFPLVVSQRLMGFDKPLRLCWMIPLLLKSNVAPFKSKRLNKALDKMTGGPSFYVPEIR